ncbi:type II toxin-antitoxin system RelE/ParE family toxin [Dinoroseobacter sp. S76]|uniref:type II toxin-antitoxin system RelE/ParE family toxin n=1 Tax=Dinoroseobacter sp. S76 TaxID=3415124 RepID=UPI003C7C6A14
MIKTIKHKGLKRYYERGDKSKLPADRMARIRLVMTVLDTANELADIDRPGWRLHPLKGDLQGFYAIDITGNYRMIFRFEDGDIWDLDYTDYH